MLWVSGQVISSKTVGFSSYNFGDVADKDDDPAINTDLVYEAADNLVVDENNNEEGETVQKKLTHLLLPAIWFPHKSPDSRLSDPPLALRTWSTCACFSLCSST